MSSFSEYLGQVTAERLKATYPYQYRMLRYLELTKDPASLGPTIGRKRRARRNRGRQRAIKGA